MKRILHLDGDAVLDKQIDAPTLGIAFDPALHRDSIAAFSEEEGYVVAAVLLIVYHIGGLPLGEIHEKPPYQIAAKRGPDDFMAARVAPFEYRVHAGQRAGIT
jgi:hypothetical protein